MIWCAHCPASRAQFPVHHDDVEMTMALHIAECHSGTGQWEQGDDWDVITADERGDLAQHLETITA